MLRLASLLVLVAGTAVIVATHPEPFSSWGAWALSPLVVYWVALVVGRGMAFTTTATAAYVLLFSAVAGLGDESYTVIARLVYLVLPLVGVLGLVIVATGAASIAVVLGRDRRGPRLPTRRASLVTGAAVAATWVLAGQFLRPEVVVAERGPGAPPSIAVVRCAGDDTYLLTPDVRTQTDGVHVTVTNEGDREIELSYEIDDGGGGGGGDVLAPGTRTLVVPFAAETVGFACLDKRPDTSAYATARVFDPQNVAREPQVSCTRSRRQVLDGSPTSDVVQAARRVMRVRGLVDDGDRVVPAVAIAAEFPVVLLLRDDRAIAMVSFTSVEGGRYVATDLDLCSGATPG